MLYQLSYTRAGPIYQGAQGRGKQAAPYTCSRKLRRSASLTRRLPAHHVVELPLPHPPLQLIHQREEGGSKESTMKSSGW